MTRDGGVRPLISCILPTYDRRGFLPHAIHYFLRQDYPNKELLIVDDGADAVGDLIPQHPCIRYLRLAHKITLGAKLNLCCEQVPGSIIAQWDDDDWYASDRLTRQMDALERTGSQVCGINDLLYYDVRRGTGHRYVYPPGQRPWLLGASLFFRRELWERNRFAAIDVGMDGIFVWAVQPDRVFALPEPRLAVHLIHDRNVSPKSPRGAWWSDHPVPEIAQLMGPDWEFYRPGTEMLAAPRPRAADSVDHAGNDVRVELVVREEASPRPRPARNIYACLVHEARDCVVDLARNLRHVDEESTILLYDGGRDPGLLARDGTLDSLDVVIHPSPRPMRWGSLHDFALDCMRFALGRSGDFDTLTIVDSDQLALRSGWPARLGECLAQSGERVGVYGNRPERLLSRTDVSAAITAWQEVELWRPFLRRFAGGEDKFVHWTFWPSTVFTAAVAHELVRLFDQDQQLKRILQHSRLWVTEEILFPTLTALLGFEVARSPGSYDFVRYRQPYTQAEVEAALARADAFWIHPVPRRYDDPTRTAIRARWEYYDGGVARAGEMGAGAAAGADAAARRAARLNDLRRPVLAAMRQVSGWLGDDEADLLITMTDRALATCAEARALVEVGSFRGKATTVLASVVRAMRPGARIWAVDPHDGIVGALDQGVRREGPTLASFQQNIARAGLEPYVETVQSRATEVPWAEPICLLLIDGLHDYGSVARDFHHFESFVVTDGLVAFHDYAEYFPGVKRFVDELIHSGRYQLAERASSMVVLCKRAELYPTTDAVRATASEDLARGAAS
jgi:hypothetical protein